MPIQEIHASSAPQPMPEPRPERWHEDSSDKQLVSAKNVYLSFSPCKSEQRVRPIAPWYNGLITSY